MALCLNRVLSRQAYDKRSSRVREAVVEEQPAGDEATVWMQPCWAVGSLVLESFAKTGWPHRITGARDGGIVENLPVHELAIGYEGADRIAIPTEVFFSTETQKALGRLGVLALASQPNSDAAYLLSAATAYVPLPKRAMGEEGPEAPPRLPRAPLGDQLFVGRVVQFLRALGGKIGPDEAPAQVKKVLEAALWELFRDAPAGMELEVDVSRGGHGLEGTVTLHPRRFHGVSMESITLGVPLG
jgi:predicted component of type VI protein secretion system